MVSFEEFKKLDLRVARIVSVAAHPNADKLYVMRIDLGGETKQSVAGLKPHFRPEELVGKLVAVVANLEPANLRGVESQCMILAAQEGSRVVCLVPEKEVGVGATIR